MRKGFGLFFIVASVFISACSMELSKTQPRSPDTNLIGGNFNLDFNSGRMSCSAVLAPDAGSVAVSGQPAPIQVKAKGGVAPYEILNTAIAFDAETVLSRTYTNTGSTNTFVVDTIVVTDQLGRVTQCNFLVAVAPAGNPPQDLACSMVASPSSAGVNQTIAFTATAQGGTAPYTFSQFSIGTDGTVTTPLSSTGNVASASGKYSTSGLRSATMQLADSAGNSVACATSVDVAAAPAVAVVAAPATSVVAGQSITLTASSNGFTSTPTYSFSTTRSGVQISSNGAVATVTSSTIQSAFDVTVTAVANGQSATTQISLSFTGSTSLACSVSHPAGIYYTGDTVTFTATAQNGEALEITYFATHSDGTAVSQTDASRSVKYSVAGVKYALVQAKSKSTGALCQAGAVMSDTVEITPPVAPALTCSGHTSYNPSYRYEWFYAWATISGGQGAKWVDSITVKQNGANASYDGYWVDANTARLQLYFGGAYEIKFFLKDTNGGTGSCTTTHTVWY